MFQINFPEEDIAAASTSFPPRIRPNYGLSASSKETSLSSSGYLTTASPYRGYLVCNGSVKLLMYSCSECEYSTNEMVNLNRHVETVHHETMREFK